MQKKLVSFADLEYVVLDEVQTILAPPTEQHNNKQKEALEEISLGDKYNLQQHGKHVNRLFTTASVMTTPDELVRPWCRQDYFGEQYEMQKFICTARPCNNITLKSVRHEDSNLSRLAFAAAFVFAEVKGKTIIFTHKIREAKNIASFLEQLGEQRKVHVSHCFTPEDEREQIMKAFKNPNDREQILVACKVPASGMNIPGLDNVALIDMIWDLDDLYNRCYRVGGRGNHGKVYAFYEPGQLAERQMVKMMFNHTNNSEKRDVLFDANSVPGAYTLQSKGGQTPAP